MQTFAKNLDRLMTAMALTNQALSVSAGTTRSHISLIRNGKARDITLRTAENIAKALGVPLSDLVKA